MQKRLSYILLLVFLFSLILSACQASPNQAVVTSKNGGVFDDRIQQTAPQREENEIILEYNDSFTSIDGSVEFTWSLDQTLDIGAMPVLEVVPYLFTGEDVKVIAEAIFGGGTAFYDAGPRSQRQLSKSELQEKIILLSQYANKEDLDWLLGEEADLDELKNRIERYTQQYDTAPDSNSYTICDWTLKPSNYYENTEDGGTNSLIATTRIGDLDYQINVRVRNQNDYLESIIEIGLGDGNEDTYVERIINTAKLCTTKKPTEEQINLAKMKAQNILDKIKLGDFVIAETFIDVSYYGDTPAYQIWIEAEPVFEGSPVLYGDFGRSYVAEEQYNSEYPIGQIQFFFSANGDLISFCIHSLVELKEVVNTNVATLSIDELIAKAEKHMSLYDAKSLDKFTINALMLEALTGRSIDTLYCKVEITEASYGLARFPVADSNSFYYAPAIIFRGTIDYCDPETGEIVTGTGNPYGTRIQTLAVVNAVDGTIF